MNKLLKTGLLVFGSAAVGSVMTQRAIANSLNSEDSSADEHRFHCDEIIFETRSDAQDILDGMDKIISDYGMVTVADLYDLRGLPCRDYTANKYGWTNLYSAKAVRVRAGYKLELPKTKSIE